MAYKNNHYVPRLILRRYGEKINRYNIKSGEYFCHRNIDKSFSQDNLYGEELEKEFNKIEGPFSQLIDKKILNKQKEIVLYRDDINLIKRFLLLLQLRAPSALGKNIFKNSKIKNLLNLCDIRGIKVENESDLEYSKRTIKCIINCKNFDELKKCDYRTDEAICWWILYNNCYLAIWDSEESKEDFIITDIGMTCEHEPSRFLYDEIGGELAKIGYLINRIDNCKNENQKEIYSQTLCLCEQVQANFYMFPVSEHRMIGLVNPFFRLYFDENKQKIINSVPDFWPSLINKDALKCNRSEYKNAFYKDSICYVTSYDPKDKYIYDVISLDIEDVIYINSLMLDRADTLIGFVETKNILKSLSTYMNIISPRVDYSKLKTRLEELGYTISKNQKYKDLGSKFSTMSIGEIEQHYIDYLLNSLNTLIGKEK